ncbi:hypothetical protein BU15DRAFT_79084 [Melanogaster broomeanus]|nr:hypothetical protein BU15DRAFT_79084 [Melanogaster broomeanus]
MTQSTSSELMGALGQDAQNNIYVAQSAYSNIFNPFPGPYHPYYLSQNFQMPSDAVPFSTVETLDTEHLLMIGKHILAPPMLAADSSPQFVHPPMLPAEELPMDLLHPPMLPQEEDNVFVTYLQPPKMLHTEDPNIHQQQQNQQQNQRHQHYSGESFGTSQTEFYDSYLSQYRDKYDIHLCAQSSLLRILGRFHDEIFSDSNSPTGLNKSIDFLAVTLQHDAHVTTYFEEWTKRFNEESHPDDPRCHFRCTLLPFLVNYSRLVMYPSKFQHTYSYAAVRLSQTDATGPSSRPSSRPSSPSSTTTHISPSRYLISQGRVLPICLAVSTVETVPVPASPPLCMRLRNAPRTPTACKKNVDVVDAVVKRHDLAVCDNNHIHVTLVVLQCRQPQFGSQRDAGLHPSQADFVELHGMGTVVGDATEVNRAGAVFAEGRDGRDVLIGSVESNVGHGGAYMTSLVKVAMMLENKQVLPKGYFKKASCRIDFAGYNLCVPVAVEDFIPGEPNSAGGHTVLREHEPRPILSENIMITLREPLYLFAIGELSVKGCSTLVDKYKEECADVPPLALCEHLGNRTRQLTWRTFAIADSIQAATFPEPVLVPKRPSPLVLCFSGQGPQHWQQGRDLYYTFRVSRDAIDECDRVHVGCTGESFMETTGLFKPDAPKDSPLAKSLMWPSDITLIALTFIQIALFDLLISLGLKPISSFGALVVLLCGCFGAL